MFTALKGFQALVAKGDPWNELEMSERHPWALGSWDLNFDYVFILFLCFAFMNLPFL